MPHHVLTLPSGNLGLYSTVVDAFLVIGTVQDVSDRLYDLGYSQTAAREKVRRGQCPPTTDPSAEGFTLRDAVIGLSLRRSLCNFHAHLRELDFDPALWQWAEDLYHCCQAEAAGHALPVMDAPGSATTPLSGRQSDRHGKRRA